MGYVDPASLLSSKTCKLTIDFCKDTPESLHKMVMPFEFTSTQTTLCHGLACWFDVAFNGADVRVTLDTGPSSPGTHWYQCRLLLREPLAVNAMQRIGGTLTMVANDKYSYHLTLSMHIVGSEYTRADGLRISSSVGINLQDQMYHYLSSSTSAYSHGGTGSAAATEAAAAMTSEAASSSSSASTVNSTSSSSS